MGALRYLNEFQKPLNEGELPSGAHLRSSRTLHKMRGFKLCKDDLAESYNRYHNQMMKHQKKSLLGPENKGLRTDQFCPVITEKRAVEKLKRKPGEGLGWSTEPRKEAVIGFVDRRLTLKGYIGGVKTESQDVPTEKFYQHSTIKNNLKRVN